MLEIVTFKATNYDPNHSAQLRWPEEDPVKHLWFPDSITLKGLIMFRQTVFSQPFSSSSCRFSSKSCLIIYPIRTGLNKFLVLCVILEPEDQETRKDLFRWIETLVEPVVFLCHRNPKQSAHCKIYQWQLVKFYFCYWLI